MSPDLNFKDSFNKCLIIGGLVCRRTTDEVCRGNYSLVVAFELVLVSLTPREVSTNEKQGVTMSRVSHRSGDKDEVISRVFETGERECMM